MDFFQMFVDKLNEINEKRLNKKEAGKRHENPKSQITEQELFDPGEYENPYVGQIREILEQILKQKEVRYRDFYPILIAGDEDEVVLSVLKQLVLDLNHVQIVTDHPISYMETAEELYTEQGLVVEVCHRSQFARARWKGNLVLDFTRTPEQEIPGIKTKMIWIPLYKKKWESRGNLDIAVPIGYNTVIVKSTTQIQEQPVYDRLEQEFYL